MHLNMSLINKGAKAGSKSLGLMFPGLTCLETEASGHKTLEEAFQLLPGH